MDLSSLAAAVVVVVDGGTAGKRPRFGRPANGGGGRHPVTAEDAIPPAVGAQDFGSSGTWCGDGPDVSGCGGINRYGRACFAAGSFFNHGGRDRLLKGQCVGVPVIAARQHPLVAFDLEEIIV